MFAGLSRGWTLTKTSFQVLKLDKEILALPILSAVLMVVATLAFLVPLGAAYVADASGLLVLLGVFALYVVWYFIGLYFTAATVEMATIRFNGGDPVLKDGLRKAWHKKGRIFQWSLVAATVGLILNILDSLARQNDSPMMRILGQIAVAVAGAAWNIATFFVVPILIYQDMGPFDALKTSVGTWRRAFGEGAGALFSTGIVFFLLGLLAIVPFFLGASIGGVAGLVLIGVAVLYLIALAVVNSAVRGIVTAAVYKYAVDGRMPEAFEGTGVPVAARNLYA